MRAEKRKRVYIYTQLNADKNIPLPVSAFIHI